VSAEAEAARAHLLKADDTMAALVERLGEVDFDGHRSRRPDDAYGALLRTIIGQQLSVKAARSIYGRLVELFGGHTPSPAELLAADPEVVRAVGLSRSKVAYIYDLARKIEDGDLHLDQLADMSDDDVIAELTQVKGLGRWTADMFLMFHLGRPDVLAVGDLGIRRAIERLYGFEEIPDAETIERLAERWRPYRTYACIYLWESSETKPAV
jgi:DNA-3-methyladenine glycosylase II